MNLSWFRKLFIFYLELLFGYSSFSLVNFENNGNTKKSTFLSRRVRIQMWLQTGIKSEHSYRARNRVSPRKLSWNFSPCRVSEEKACSRQERDLFSLIFHRYTDRQRVTSMERWLSRAKRGRGSDAEERPRFIFPFFFFIMEKPPVHAWPSGSRFYPDERNERSAQPNLPLKCGIEMGAGCKKNKTLNNLYRRYVKYQTFLEYRQFFWLICFLFARKIYNVFFIIKQNEREIIVRSSFSPW